MVKLVNLPAGRQARRSQKVYYVYILRSLKTGEYYKGLTNNIDIRLEQHFQGKSATTKKMLPLKLVHVELLSLRSEARILEKYFKSGFGREIIKEIDGY
jgi:putative endonuclease